MSKATVVLPILLLLLTTGCGGGGGGGVERWEMAALTDFGRQPHWSPDGSQLLFGDDTPASPGLWLVEPDGTSQPLSDEITYHNWDYRWSPDGASIAFTVPGDTGSATAGLWVFTLSNGDLERIIPRGRDVTWLPDGAAVALQLEDPPGGEPGVYRVELAGGATTLLVAGGHRPSHSPTGGWLACSDGETGGRLKLLSPSGDLLTASEPGAVQWVWCASGERLFCVVNSYLTGTLKGDLWRINVSGEGITATDTAFASWSAYPAPDPAGERVAVQRTSSGRWAGVWLLSRGGDGWDELKIADYGQNPEWDPTGDRIALNGSSGGIRLLHKI